MNIVLLMMAGSGTRFGAAVPKQFTIINELPIFITIIKGYETLESIDKIIIVSHPEWLDQVKNWTKHYSKVVAVTAGGSNRSESVLNGLLCAKSLASENDIILIHDATHPYVDYDGTERVIEATQIYGAATLANFNYDTVYRINDDEQVVEVLPRTRVINGASPEAFHFGIIFPIYNKASQEELANMTSAGAIALEHGIHLHFVQTDILNLKITYKRDMDLYQTLGETYFIRKGE